MSKPTTFAQLPNILSLERCSNPAPDGWYQKLPIGKNRDTASHCWIDNPAIKVQGSVQCLQCGVCGWMSHMTFSTLCALEQDLSNK